jgi:hypothetical protein
MKLVKLLFLLVSVVLIYLSFWLGIRVSKQDFPKKEEGIACTMEVKICPDGTAVGRQPPTCEFAPCPLN